MISCSTVIKWILHTLVCIVLCLHSIPLAARNKSFTQIKKFANVDAIDFTRDAYGFMWIACNSELIRYDGYDIVIYNDQDENPNQITVNEVWELYIDTDNQLWVSGGNRGCARYDYATEKFTGYDSVYGNQPAAFHAIRDFAEDSEGNLWVVSRNGLSCKKADDDRFELIVDKDSNGNPLGFVYALHIDQDGKIWIGNDMGNLYQYLPHKDVLQRYARGVFTQESQIRNPIEDITRDSKNKLWVCGNLRAVQIDLVTHEHVSVLSHMLDPNKVKFVLEDPQGNYWFSAGGLTIYNPETGVVEQYVSDQSSENTLSSNVTTNLYVDPQGVFWVGSWYGGVDIFNSTKKPFRQYTKLPCQTNSLSDNIVHCFYQDAQGAIWIGTEDGLLNKYNPDTDSFEQYADPNMLINEAITAITQGANPDELILATWGAVKIFNTTQHTFTRLIHEPDNPKSIRGNLIPCLLKGGENNVWMAIDWGLLEEMDLATNTFTHHIPKTDTCNARLDFIRNMFIDKYGYLWLVGWADLFRYDIQNQCFHTIKQSDTAPYALGVGQVYCCFQDSKDRLWVGNSKGINLYNYEEDNFINFKIQYGSEDSEVNSILEDNDGNLWLTTDKGISKFMLPAVITRFTKDGGYKDSLPDDFVSFLNYDTYDGLPEENFLKGALKAYDDRMYFGGTGGFTVFNPSEVVRDTIRSPIRFIEFRIFNQLVRPRDKANPESPLTKSIVLTQNITLSHKQYIFSLKWAALNYYAAAKVKYSYMLDGFDPDWSIPGAVRSATYTGLPAGNYTFRVKATNADGIWNQPEASLRITILPPWWNTWWFRIAALLASLFLIVLFIYFRLNNLHRQKKQLKQNVEARTRELQKANETKDKFFSIIAHDLKDPFSAIISYSELLKDNYKDYNDTERYTMIRQVNNLANKTFMLLNNLLTWSRAHTGKIEYRPEIIDITEYVDTNITLLKESARKKGINFKYHIPEGYEVYADRNSANAILRNLITNAIKFTPRNGSITISATPHVKGVRKFIEFTVVDTGVGMPPEITKKLFRIDQSISTRGTEKETGTGLGLLLCKEFIQNNGGTIRAESEEGIGSKFIFTLPQVGK